MGSSDSAVNMVRLELPPLRKEYAKSSSSKKKHPYTIECCGKNGANLGGPLNLPGVLFICIYWLFLSYNFFDY